MNVSATSRSDNMNIFISNEPIPGEIRPGITDIGLNVISPGMGSIAEITFDVDQDATPGTLNLTLSDVLVIDTYGLSLPVTVDNGVFTILDPTMVKNEKSQIPKSYGLEQNYPNPFNPVTRIKFSLPEQQLVQIEVFDATGKSIYDLLNKTMTAVNHQVEFNAENLPSGIYFYRIQEGEFQDVKKMILLNKAVNI